jgi:hypothetical protein
MQGSLDGRDGRRRHLTGEKWPRRQLELGVAHARKARWPGDGAACAASLACNRAGRRSGFGAQ